MSSVSHQTVKLSRGKHAFPEDGACVMELASMLSGERFSDHPESVCPVIGSFLRAYNDSVDDARRQDLYAFAAGVVGSSGSATVQRARADHLAAWTQQNRDRRWSRWFVPTRLRSAMQQRSISVLGIDAVRSIPRLTDDTHAAALALIDELLAITTSGGTCSPPAPREASTQSEPDGLDVFLHGAHFW